MDERLRQDRAECARREVRPQARRQHHAPALQAAGPSKEVERHQAAVRIGRAFDEEAALGQPRAQRRQGPGHRGLVVLPEHVERADHGHRFPRSQGKVEAAMAELEPGRRVGLRLRHARGIDLHPQHPRSRVETPQAPPGLRGGHGIRAIPQIHVEASQMAHEGGERDGQKGIRLPQAIWSGLAPRGPAERLPHGRRS
jgi:hypothetical protein